MYHEYIRTYTLNASNKMHVHKQYAHVHTYTHACKYAARSADNYTIWQAYRRTFIRTNTHTYTHKTTVSYIDLQEMVNNSKQGQEKTMQKTASRSSSPHATLPKIRWTKSMMSIIRLLRSARTDGLYTIYWLLQTPLWATDK